MDADVTQVVVRAAFHKFVDTCCSIRERCRGFFSFFVPLTLNFCSFKPEFLKQEVFDPPVYAVTPLRLRLVPIEFFRYDEINRESPCVVLLIRVYQLTQGVAEFL